ncbi:MAG: hypothetical protein PHF21_02205 [Bacilli bacterium]|nr:hypothetical protein [Bacilli bacterium]
MINLLTTSGIVGDSLMNMLNSICLFVDTIVYWFISIAYQVFVAISQVNLFGESTLRIIIDRVFTILGVVMLFIMAYEIILLIINPDKLSGDNGAKKLITKVLTSIILIVLLPTIFNYMQVFQYNVLTSNVIGNVIIGGSSRANETYDLKSAGTSMALTIASAFFHPITADGVEHSYISCQQEESAPKVCDVFIETYDTALAESNPSGLFSSELQDYLQLNLWEKITSQERQMKYMPILSTIAAIFAIKTIIAFSLDIGIRVAKLGFLQIVAPIPIALNIRAKESIFNSKWFKQLTDTYLMIFVRLIIIYFAMFAISLVPEVISNMWVTGGNFLIQIMATVAVVLGILQFAKDGPDLLKQLFDLEINTSIKKRLDDNTYAQRGLATIGGGASSFVSNAYDGFKNEKGVLNTAFSAAGGLIGGGRRGWKNSEGIDSFGKVGSVVSKSRAESDAARAHHEDVRDRAIANDWGTVGGKAVPGVTRIAGEMMGVPEKLGDYKDDFVKWVGGESSLEKLEAAKAGQESFKTFLERLNLGDDQIKASKDANSKALATLSEKMKVENKHLLSEFRRENNIPADVNDNDLIFNNKDALAEYIESYYKKEIKNRTISNFSKKGQLYTNEVNNLVADLTTSLNALGTETAKTILGSGGFSSIKEMELALKDINNPNFSQYYDDVMKVKKSIDIETSNQTSLYTGEIKKDKK